MAEDALALGAQAAGARSARVLAFTVDDGLFAIHLDWVETVYPGDAVTVHALKTAGGSYPFLFHRDEPALLVDLREAFDLRQPLGRATRSAYLMVRSGSILLALPIDACVGVRDIDFRTQTPVPTRLLRDGGVPVGHLVELDQKILVVLDPNRMLDGGARETRVDVYRKAQLFRERQLRMAVLWTEIRAHPTLAQVRAYARLCSRTGRARTAAAAREVLEHMTAAPADTNGAAPVLLAEIIRRARERDSGELGGESAGPEAGRLIFHSGRGSDAVPGAAAGAAACKLLLAMLVSSLRWQDCETGARPVQIQESTVALAIETLDQLAGERRGRRAR
jgi:chemotaxis signal transduction protein